MLRPLLEGFCFLFSSSFWFCFFLVKEMGTQLSPPHPWAIGGHRDKLKERFWNAIKSQWKESENMRPIKNCLFLNLMGIKYLEWRLGVQS